MYSTLLTLQLTDQSLPLGFLRVEEEIMTPSFFSSWELMLEPEYWFSECYVLGFPAEPWTDFPFPYLEKQDRPESKAQALEPKHLL